MAGGAAKYRHLSRKSSHRQALLRNLVTSLFKHESITTTWAKAKEAQRLAEKLITLGKKNTETSRRTALSTFYVCFPVREAMFRGRMQSFDLLWK
jgi:ribosomal protein L17